MNTEIAALAKAEQDLEYLVARKNSLAAEFEQATATLTAADKALTEVLGREALAESSPKEVTSTRDAWNRADQNARGLESAQSVIAERIEKAELALAGAKQALAAHTAQIAADRLPSHVARIGELVDELAKEIIIAVRLDDAARNYTGALTQGRALELSLGSPLERLVSHGIKFGESGFIVVREPAPLSTDELLGLTK